MQKPPVRKTLVKDAARRQKETVFAPDCCNFRLVWISLTRNLPTFMPFYNVGKNSSEEVVLRRIRLWHPHTNLLDLLKLIYKQIVQFYLKQKIDTIMEIHLFNREVLRILRFDLVNHPPYPPDFATSDY